MSPWYFILLKSREPRVKSTNRHIRFLNHAYAFIKNSRISRYLRKYSKRVYSQHQLVAILLLREYFPENYRDIVELLECSEIFKEFLGLHRVPQITTLHTFLQLSRSPLLSNSLQKDLKLAVWSRRTDHGYRNWLLWIYIFVCQLTLLMENRQISWPI